MRVRRWTIRCLQSERNHVSNVHIARKRFATIVLACIMRDRCTGWDPIDPLIHMQSMQNQLFHVHIVRKSFLTIAVACIMRERFTTQGHHLPEIRTTQRQLVIVNQHHPAHRQLMLPNHQKNQVQSHRNRMNVRTAKNRFSANILSNAMKAQCTGHLELSNPTYQQLPQNRTVNNQLRKLRIHQIQSHRKHLFNVRFAPKCSPTSIIFNAMK